MTGLILGAVLAVVVLAIIATIKSLIIICPPNRVAVISGRSRQLSDGRTVGYRAIRGGRTLRVPLLERVSWMELNTIPIEVSVQNAYSKGAIPLHVQGIANVKVSSIEGLLQNSVERFLDVDQAHIAAIAKETLEANLRGVLATLTPEEVNEDRLKFAQTLIEEADDDIKTLGLELDVLKIQNVTDEVGYLDSVGRRQTAEVLKEARVAEAQRKAEAEESEALSRQRAEIATAQADLMIVEQQNALRVRQAELEAIAGAAEAEAKVAGAKARVIAEQALETERVQLETRRLEADVVAPARADLEARELAAKADAAKIIEDGNAQIEVFRRLVEQYQAAGPDAQRVFVLRMLPDLMEKIVSVVGAVDIDKVSIIDSGGQGTGIPGFMGQLPAAVIGLTEQIENATGVDLLKALRPSDGASTQAAKTP
ncbi:MAG TPA: SPFH domain-containing protein [Acidimicrobiales bacterium]|nr:SPFH domain-containing protein [Acidimicrobiales bacterium]